MVADLTGLDTANASLLDEGTAVAEAVTLMRRRYKGESNRVVVDADCFPQTLAVLKTRLAPLGIEVVLADLDQGLPTSDLFGIVGQYPSCSGRIRDFAAVTEEAHAHGALVAVTTDLLALTMLTPPGEWGADVVVGSSQRFGVPLWYGGPHAAFMAVRSGLERDLPGRLVGVSVDAKDRPAYRLALQTREQHIRREKATSNICTAQVLLAVVASMYAVYHGPDGLGSIAWRVHSRTVEIADGLERAGFALDSEQFFDTLLVQTPQRAESHRRRRARQRHPLAARRRGSCGCLVRRDDDDRTCHRGLARLWSRRRPDLRIMSGSPFRVTSSGTARSWRSRSSPNIIRRRPCCGICAGSPTRTLRSTGA